jgi:hypothetical protein
MSHRILFRLMYCLAVVLPLLACNAPPPPVLTPNAIATGVAATHTAWAEQTAIAATHTASALKVPFATTTVPPTLAPSPPASTPSSCSAKDGKWVSQWVTGSSTSFTVSNCVISEYVQQIIAGRSGSGLVDIYFIRFYEEIPTKANQFSAQQNAGDGIFLSVVGSLLQQRHRGHGKQLAEHNGQRALFREM